MTFPLAIAEDDERCACGRPLHYANYKTRVLLDKMIAQYGPTVAVTTSAGTWMVPRHYIALHGLRAVEVERLAARYGWERGVPRRHGHHH
jgi:hypothetical protein